MLKNEAPAGGILQDTIPGEIIKLLTAIGSARMTLSGTVTIRSGISWKAQKSIDGERSTIGTSLFEEKEFFASSCMARLRFNFILRQICCYENPKYYAFEVNKRFAISLVFGFLFRLLNA